MSRDHDIAFFTSAACAIFGVGLWLFAADMRTVGAPDDHILIADIGTYLLAGTAVAAGLVAWFSRPRRIRREG